LRQKGRRKETCLTKRPTGAAARRSCLEGMRPVKVSQSMFALMQQEGDMKSAKNILVIVPTLIVATTAFAQSGKQMIINRNNNATTSADTHALNPQPIPPGISHELNPQPIPPGKYHALNPQPIPPGIMTNGHPKKKKRQKRKLD
jgi:hypothetical protein